MIKFTKAIIEIPSNDSEIKILISSDYHEAENEGITSSDSDYLQSDENFKNKI